MNKIDTTKDFIKSVGSFKAAKRLISSLSNDGGFSYSIRKYGNLIDSAYGKVEGLLEFSYNPMYKTVRVTYIDGREKPKAKEAKDKYYVVWIEGLSARNGEKILSLDDNDHTYTTSMTQAMRVKKEDRQLVFDMLVEQGVSEGFLLMQGTFHPVSYAPKGTLFKP